jgi:hypothetical protein
MSRDIVTGRQITLPKGSRAGDPAVGPGLLEFAAREPIAGHRPLGFGDGARIGGIP